MKLEEKHKWTLGYLGMTTQLSFENKLSFKAGLKRVANCMRSHGIKATVRKKKYNRIKRQEEYVNDNLLNEQFNRQSKNEVWVTDTTEVLYGINQVKKTRVHVVLDLYGRYALSYNISPTETAVSVIEVFERAFKVEPGGPSADPYGSRTSILFNDF